MKVAEVDVEEFVNSVVHALGLERPHARLFVAADLPAFGYNSSALPADSSHLFVTKHTFLAAAYVPESLRKAVFRQLLCYARVQILQSLDILRKGREEDSIHPQSTDPVQGSILITAMKEVIRNRTPKCGVPG